VHWQSSIDAAELHRLERDIVNVADRDQQRIGNDLHESIGQDLTGIALQLRCVLAQLKKETSHARPDVEDLVGLVNNVLLSTRELARGQLPVSAKLGALPAALQLLAARASMRLQIDIEFMDWCRPKLRLDAAAATLPYRIAQESLTNAVRRPSRSCHIRLGAIENGKRSAPDTKRWHLFSCRADDELECCARGTDPWRWSRPHSSPQRAAGPKSHRRGQSSRIAAQALGLSVKTVETHRRTLKRKLNLATNGQLLQFAINWFTHRARPPAA
jgi:Histidine kinase/Bacterial regulatory proteins, luxR family